MSPTPKNPVITRITLSYLVSLEYRLVITAQVRAGRDTEAYITKRLRFGAAAGENCTTTTTNYISEAIKAEKYLSLLTLTSAIIASTEVA